jgi:phenylpropionate dioxygenase-like ring-hydroxylating dioxygenase large terminal subunit
MLTAEHNALITQSGPGTPLGAFMRQYWQPAALVDEFEGPRPVRRVRLLGEDLVLFRDQAGRYGLLDRHCAHRGADLSYGRAEDGGLRCPFHGWLFDATGACLDQPAEPIGSNFCKSIRQPAYPCQAVNGIVFAYLGAGEPPALPAFDCFAAPESYTFAFKGQMECNWLQALEVGIDPAHASYLHRFFEDESTEQAYGKQFRGATMGADMPMTKILREYGRPRIEVETTDFGMRIAALRQLNDSEMHIRITNMAFPHAFVIPMSKEMTITQWHVPIDDTHCYWYAIFTSFTQPVDKVQMREQRLGLYQLPDYIPRTNRLNDYGFDPHEQETSTYTGMGDDINVHDQWAVESMGAIQDRTKEHLGSSDKAIAAYRRLLVRAIRDVGEGRKPLLAVPAAVASRIHGPASIDAIGPIEGWQAYWQEQDRHRRDAAPWNAALSAVA